MMSLPKDMQKLSLATPPAQDEDLQSDKDKKVEKTQIEGMDDLSLREQMKIFRIINAKRREELRRKFYAESARKHEPTVKVEAPDEDEDEDEDEDKHEDAGKKYCPWYYSTPDGVRPSKTVWVL